MLQARSGVTPGGSVCGYPKPHEDGTLCQRTKPALVRCRWDRLKSLGCIMLYTVVNVNREPWTMVLLVLILDKQILEPASVAG